MTDTATKIKALDRAIEILSDPEKWLQGYYAATHDPETGDLIRVSEKDPEADCFCGMGALYRASYEVTNGRAAGTVVSADVAAAIEIIMINDEDKPGALGDLVCANKDADHQRLAVLEMFKAARERLSE